MNGGAVKTRDLSVDLAKIVGMLLVVLYHTLGYCRADWTREALGPIAQCCINVFAIVSGYVCFASAFRYRRIVRLWFQVWTTGWLIGLVSAFAIGYDITAQDVLKMFLPVATREYWYFTDYFLLFFFIPCLNVAVRGCQRQVLVVLGVSIALLCGTSIFLNFDALHVHNGFSFLWLMILYLVGATLRNCRDKIPTCRQSALLFAAIALMVFLMRVAPIHKLQILGSLLSCHYTGLAVFLMSVALGASLVQLPVSRVGGEVVSFFAPTVFGIYLLHCQPVFMYNVWNVKMGALANLPGPGGVVAICVTVLFFGVLACIERVRMWLWASLGCLFESVARKLTEVILKN